MTLDVAIATWQPSGIDRIREMDLPHVPGVRYIVSWQEYGTSATIPAEISNRNDIDIHLCDARGVSANRNNALNHCYADIVLMSDDDLKYNADQLKAVIHTFEERPELHLATFRYGNALKTYPDNECKLTFPLPKNYGVATFEIAIRRNLPVKLRFDELFGPGSPVWQAAEDEKFLWDARKAGLNCLFIPIDITTHNGLTTGDKPITHRGVAAASGKMIRLEYPNSWMLRILLKSWRQARIGGKFTFCLYHLLRGAFSDGKDA